MRNFFRIELELNYTAIKDTRKQCNAIKGRIIRDLKNLYENEE